MSTIDKKSALSKVIAFFQTLYQEGQNNPKFAEATAKGVKVSKDSVVGLQRSEAILKLNMAYEKDLPALKEKQAAELKEFLAMQAQELQDFDDQYHSDIEDLKEIEAYLKQENKDEHDLYIALSNITKELAASVAATRMSGFINIQNINNQIEALKKQGVDLYKDQVAEAVFKGNSIGIETGADLKALISQFEASNMDFALKAAADEFQAIIDVPESIEGNAEYQVSIKTADGQTYTDLEGETLKVLEPNLNYYTEITEAITAFEAAMTKIAADYGVKEGKVYSRFFQINGANIDNGDVTKKPKFEALKAELVEKAKTMDLAYIRSLQEEMAQMSYGTPDYAAAYQVKTINLLDKIEDVSAKYGMSKDGVITAVFGDKNITTEAELTKRLLTDGTHEITIESTLAELDSHTAERGVKVTDEFITALKNKELKTDSLKALGVSDEMITKFTTLKDSYIAALEKGENTHAIECDMSSVKIKIHGAMNSKHNKRRFALA